MARLQVLNDEGAGATRPQEAVALSRELLGEARQVSEPGRCPALERVAARLDGVAAESIEGDDERIAFWLNLYNALILHCLCLKPLRGSLLRHLRMFDRVAYRVGGRDYPLNVIENGLLRRNRRPPYRPRRPLRRSDPRLAAAPSRLDPRIHFALNCGARSCPPIKAYSSQGLDDELEAATRAYITSETSLDPESCHLTLPSLLRLYRADFGPRAERLAFAAGYLPDLKECLREPSRRIRVRYSRFDWNVTTGPTG